MLKAYYACNYTEAMTQLSPKAKEDGKDYVLYNLSLLSAALGAGDYDTAERASLNAQRVMWDVEAGKGRGKASLVSSEALKLFKGEPFEKAMASVYSGIIYFNREDYDNARAAFSKAIMATKTKAKGHQNDFALASFLLAKVYLKLGEFDNARVALGRAKKAYPRNPHFNMETLKSSNALFVVELGKGPKKIRKGPGKALVKWQRRRYPEQKAALYVDGESITFSQEAADLTFEAQTKGWTGKDAVQTAKGAVRAASTATTVIAASQAARGNKTAGWVALGAGLFSLANRSEADVRQWEFLPDRVHVLAANVGRGRHKLQVNFFGSGRRPIKGFNKVWHYNPESGDKIFLVRGSPCPAGSNMEMASTKR